MRKNTLSWKKGIAAALAVAMVGTLIPGTALAANTGSPARSGENLLAEFTFDDQQTGFTGGQAKAAGAYTLQEVDGRKAMYLNGNSDNYLKVTKTDGTSLLTGVEELTISYDAKPDRTATNWPFYAAPNENAQSSNKEHYLGILANNGKTTVERYNNTGSRPANPSADTGSGWAHVDVVVSKTDTTIYVNGVKKGTQSSSYSLPGILGDASILQIGKANWKTGEFYKGWMDNFKLYSTALSEEEITQDTEKYAVEADKSALTLPGEVTADFELPAKGASGSDITWSAEANDYITVDGSTAKVTQPADSDKEVTLTAAIAKGTYRDTKDITVKVLKVITDQDVVAKAKAALAIPNTGDIRGNISLPTEMEVANTHKKASITWQSDKPAVVTDKEAGGKAAGVVTRQNTDTKVTLTATIQCGSAKDTKAIELTVKKAYELGETTDYLFTYFVDNNKASEQIFYASSHDGDNWMDLNKNEAVLYVGDTVRSEEDIAEAKNNPGVRDPYLLRSPEGDKFYLLATDLCVGTQGWGVTTPGNGSRYLRIWESTDLVNWSEPWLGEVAPADGGNAWAPEAIYDETTGEYVVYWASMTSVDNWNKQRVYYCKTRDFRTFTEPELFIERKDANGNAYHIIDTTIIQSNGKYYRASGDGEITIDASDSLLTGWETIGTLSLAMKNAGIAGSYTGSQLEGPEFFKYNNDDVKKDENGNPIDTWALMADQYSSGRGYLPFKTTDIGDMTGASWSKPGDNDYNYDTNKKRHGSVLQLTKEEYDRVMGAYGPSSVKVAAAPTKTTYEKGDTLNPAGLRLEVTYSNGKKETVGYTDNEKNKRHFVFDVTEFNKAGTQKVTVTYGEQSASFDVKVEGGEDPEPQPADKTQLQKAIDQAKAVDEERYTEASVKVMNDALKAAEDMLNDDTLTTEQQDKVDAAVKALTEAMEKLERRKVEDIFQDINADSWYKDYVQYVFDRNIMTGMNDKEFGSDGKLARSHFATMLYRLEGEPDVVYKDIFKDVPDGAFYTNAVMWASANDIKVINGYEDGSFGPNDNITREQMAVMLYRYAKYKEYDTKDTDDLSGFEDAAKVSSFAKDAMQWAVGAGLIKGEGDGEKLNPQGETSRAVCATIMQRFIEQFNK